jgi:Kyakuja-Dileera-Zisupton transposase
MFALFQESGIFIASCCHRLVLLACDMIRSGELYVIDLSVYIFLIESSEGQNMPL